jgi:hypothetical protein
VKRQQRYRYLLKNEDAVLGLPMRLTVSLVIGTIALLAILSYILNPCLFPQKMIVSFTPMVISFSGEDPQNITIFVNVTDISGHSISGASVLIKGLGGAGSGISNTNGMSMVQLQVQLETGMHEGYLDVSVSAACHERLEQQELIKIVRVGG